jgi:hypothetical protein
MEGETSVERSTSPPEDLLKELAANETSLIALIKTLLSPKTMPHLFMIVLMSTAFYFVANSNNGEDIAALGFISLSLGYAITAIFSANEKVRSWITVTGNVDVSQFNMFQKVKASLKICAFPLAVAIAIGILIMILFSQDSATDLPAVFPISLASLFVIWAIAQGRSFSSWASSLSAKNLPDKQATTGNIVTLAVFQYTVILSLSLIGLIGFEFLYEKEWDITNAIVSNV